MPAPSTRNILPLLPDPTQADQTNVFEPESRLGLIQRSGRIELARNPQEATASVTLGLAIETDTAFSLTTGEGPTLGLTTETDSAFSVTRSKQITLGLAIETDSGLPLTTSSVSGVEPP